MIPDWLDAESLQNVIVGAIVVLALLALLVARLVRRILLRLVLVAVLGVLGVGLWQQRADLEDCVETCSCRLFDQEVAIPAGKNPNCD